MPEQQTVRIMTGRATIHAALSKGATRKDALDMFFVAMRKARYECCAVKVEVNGSLAALVTIKNDVLPTP